MANAKEIKNRIEGIQDTQKITNAMYLISSAKLRKAKAALDLTRPFYYELRSEIKRIFRTIDNVESPYYYPKGEGDDLKGTYGYLIITADKGLAGPYNTNVIKEANRLLAAHEDNEIFVVGERGRQYYEKHGIPIEQNFRYTAQNPTFERARLIGSVLLDKYLAGELKKLFLIYTSYENGLEMGAVSTRLLPFHQAHFATATVEEPVDEPFEFYPSVPEVLNHIAPSYVEGFIYSALVESFCCEQNSRMAAMNAANQNAQKILDDLRLQYHHMRQAAITQEITEVAAGAKQYEENNSAGWQAARQDDE